jgi:hypothetical protein
MDQNVLSKWNEVKSIMEEIEVDVMKNARGNAAAGVRVRKGLRHMKTLLGEHVKLSLGVEKNKSAE